MEKRSLGIHEWPVHVQGRGANRENVVPAAVGFDELEEC